MRSNDAHCPERQETVLNLTNMLAPIEQASAVPNACYVAAAMFQHEKDTLIRDNWAFLGFGKDIG